MFSLKRLLKNEQKLAVFAPLLEKAWQTKWVVHCEPSLAKAEHVIRYLGQYTHRVAITNQRILDVSNSHVRFMAKDYRDKAIKSKHTGTSIPTRPIYGVNAHFGLINTLVFVHRFFCANLCSAFLTRKMLFAVSLPSKSL